MRTVGGVDWLGVAGASSHAENVRVAEAATTHSAVRTPRAWLSEIPNGINDSMNTETPSAPIATLLENHRASLRYLERRVDTRACRGHRAGRIREKLSRDLSRHPTITLSCHGSTKYRPEDSQHRRHRTHGTPSCGVRQRRVHLAATTRSRTRGRRFSVPKENTRRLSPVWRHLAKPYSRSQ
jgi:hypothetical protein